MEGTLSGGVRWAEGSYGDIETKASSAELTHKIPISTNFTPARIIVQFDYIKAAGYTGTTNFSIDSKYVNSSNLYTQVRVGTSSNIISLYITDISSNSFSLRTKVIYGTSYQWELKNIRWVAYE